MLTIKFFLVLFIQLTYSLEVVQIARSLSRRSRFKDLTEAIFLGHDLVHAREEALN